MTSGRDVAFKLPAQAVLKSDSSPSVLERAGLLNLAASILGREAARLPLDLSPAGAPKTDPNPLFPGTPGVSPDLERLRRQVHEALETFLLVLSPRAESAQERVPLLRCAAPVDPGGDGIVAVRVANDELTPSEVTLYCTNLVADSGYDISSTRVSISPRTVAVPPKGEAVFDVRIAVPRQAPPGTYSGLFQAMGTKYVKAVVSVEVK